IAFRDLCESPICIRRGVSPQLLQSRLTTVAATATHSRLEPLAAGCRACRVSPVRDTLNTRRSPTATAAASTPAPARPASGRAEERGMDLGTCYLGLTLRGP